jgi:hypothetical protein
LTEVRDSRWAAAGEIVLVSGLYAAGAVYFTWPLAAGMRDHFAGTPLLLMDLYLVTWILAWGTHALVTDPTRLFDANAFHPTPNVIASSEHLLGDQPLFAPVYLATHNPVLALNVVVLASFVLCGVCMHVVLRAWTGSRVAALAAGIAFAFAPWRGDLGRPHLLQTQYLPLVAFFSDRALARDSIRAGVAAGLTLVLQSLCSVYLGYLAVALTATTMLVGVVWTRLEGRRIPWRACVAIGTTLAVGIVPVALPYVRAAGSGVLSGNALTPGVPWGMLVHGIGIPTIVVGSAAALLALRWRRDPTTARRAVTMIVTALLALALVPGAAGIGGPLAPFRWLTAVVPGLAYFRVPFRFGMLMAFALAVLAGLGVAALHTKMRDMGQRAVGALLATLIVGALAWNAFDRPLRETIPVQTQAEIPPVYRWLAAQNEAAPVLELPVAPLGSLQEAVAGARAMYYSTYGWYPLLNGYTGFVPPSYGLIHAWARQLPSQRALAALWKATGLRWVVMHGRRFDAHLASQVGLLHRGSLPDGRGRVDHLYEVVPGQLRRNPHWITDPDQTVDGVIAQPLARVSGALSVEPLGRARRRRSLRARVTLHNDEGEAAWPTTPLDPRVRVVLAGRWRTPAGKDAGTFTIVIPGDVAPGEEVSFEAALPTPARRGAYVMELALQQPASSATFPSVRQLITVER